MFKIGVGLFAVAFAAFATASAVSAISTRQAPETALSVWPLNGAAAARVASEEMRRLRIAKSKQEPETVGLVMPNESAAHLAKRSLVTLPLNPDAFRVLAMASNTDDQTRINTVEAASRLSRRDLLTQLYIIGHWAEQGDFTQALDNYDALLRRRTPARDLAGQLLARSMADGALTAKIAGLLRDDPMWKSLLFYHLQREEPSWDSFIALHRELADTNVIPIEVSSEFARRLVGRGLVEDALTVARIAADVDLEPSRQFSDKAFEVEPPFPGTWTITAPEDISFVPLFGGGVAIQLSRNTSGVIAERIVALRPGRYRARLRFATQAPTGRRVEQIPRAALACADAQASRRESSTLLVEKDCVYQRLSIVIDESAPVEADYEVNSIEIFSDG